MEIKEIFSSLGLILFFVTGVTVLILEIISLAEAWPVEQHSCDKITQEMQK